MKKQLVAGLMVMVAMLSFGCSGRNAEFGVVDMKTVESKAAIVQTVKEEVSTKGKALQEEMEKEMAGIYISGHPLDEFTETLSALRFWEKRIAIDLILWYNPHKKAGDGCGRDCNSGK